MTAKSATQTAAVPVSPAPEQPPLKQDIHFVLNVRVCLKAPASSVVEPATTPIQDGAVAASTNEQQSASAPATPNGSNDVDPSTLSLQLKFTPWVGQEVVIGPVPLTENGTSTDAPRDGNGNAAGTAPTTNKDTAPNQQPNTDNCPSESPSISARMWATEKHFKLTVDEALVRAMASAHGELLLPIMLAQPPPPPPPKPVKGQPPPPEITPVSFSSLLPLQCGGLLVGDTQVEAAWPGKLLPVPAELQDICSSIHISLKALNIPAPVVEETAAAAAAVPGGKAGTKAAAAKAPAKAGKQAPTPEPDLATLPGQATPILTPALAAKLNPLLIMTQRAKNLPDAPATPQLLDTKCHPIKLRVRWPIEGASEVAVSEQVGQPGHWTALEAKDSYGPGLNCRAVRFGQPLVILAGDYSADQVMTWCRECPLMLEIHDRTAIPQPPQFPVRQVEGNTETSEATAGMMDEEGYVCGIAKISLLDLARGSCHMTFNATIIPHTTVRGAASLDWTRRPGNYAASQACVKGWLRAAVPFKSMANQTCSPQTFNRAVFIMDYRDSELFHLLEDTVRQQNAWVLGLAKPEPKESKKEPSPSSSPIPTQPTEPVDIIRGTRPEGLLHRPSFDASHASTPRPVIHDVDVDQRSVKGAPPRRPSQSQLQANGNGSSPPRVPAVAMRQASRSIRDTSPQPTERPTIASQATRNSSTRIVLWSGRASNTGGIKDRKELRFHAFGGITSDSESDSDDSGSDEPPTEIEQQLDEALKELETIKLDNRVLQALSTTKLDSSQLSNPDLDLITGWHVVDGQERIIAVEGRAAGAMQAIQAIARWALEDAQPEDEWRRRGVLYNSDMRHAARLWGELGVDLHILKLASPLHKIVADAASYATGMVRVECIAGLRRLAALRNAPWARLAHDLCLYPTPHMVHLLDKKFGGELTKSDVFGVEVLDYETDEEDGGGLGLVAGDDARSSHSSKRSGKSGRSRRSSKTRRTGRSQRSRSTQHSRKRPVIPPIDRQNDAYLAMREEARVRRLATDWHAHNLAHLSSLATTSAAIRRAWAEWNPSGHVSRALQDQARISGSPAENAAANQPVYLTSSADKIPAYGGMISKQEAKEKGWYPHKQQFKWPAPIDPSTYNQHPHAPSLFRVEQLTEPWEEPGCTDTAAATAGLRADVAGPGFITTVKNKTGLFGQDPDYFKTVHLGGVGREQEEAERKAAEKAEWTRKLLVDDPVMHTTLPMKPDKPAQLDRTKHILHDSPKKKGLAISYTPPPPYSMHSAQPWQEPNIRDGLRGKDVPTQYLNSEVDFKRYLAKQKRAVCVPGPGNMQSWTAEMHDARYNDE